MISSVVQCRRILHCIGATYHIKSKYGALQCSKICPARRNGFSVFLLETCFRKDTLCFYRQFFPIASNSADEPLLSADARNFFHPLSVMAQFKEEEIVVISAVILTLFIENRLFLPFQTIVMVRFQLAYRLFVVAVVFPAFYRGYGISVPVFLCRIEGKFRIQDFPTRLIFPEIGIDFFKTETGWQIL